jgi:mono/diheme cytochrome c family protein
MSYFWMRRSGVGFAAVLFSTLVVTSGAAGQDAPDGESLYRQHCGRCHEGEMPTIMLPGTIHDLPADWIYEAINFFGMQRHVASLTTREE